MAPPCSRWAPACDDGTQQVLVDSARWDADEAVFEDPALEIEGTVRDQLDGKVLAVSLGGAGTDRPLARPRCRAALQGAAQEFWRALDHVCEPLRGQPERVVVLVEDETHPPVYYLVDYAAKKADIINEGYPLLSGVKLGAVRDFNYEARDKYALDRLSDLAAGAAKRICRWW